jgi:dUTP pyrophosphatase
MNNPLIKFVKTHTDATLPFYATVGAAGADLYAVLDDGAETLTIGPLARAIVSTGMRIEIPDGYEVQVRPRSGLAAKNGVTVLNAPGTIDSDYRGEIGVILINLGEDDFVIRTGDRIAQIVVAPVSQAKFEWVNDLTETARGEGGYGSTGVSKV